FVSLFTPNVVYVVHPTDETVTGTDALRTYLRKEKEAQGAVRVRMGSPVVEGNKVVAEFWVDGEDMTIVGCILARLDDDGRCSQFREYWFDIEGNHDPFEGWGT